MRELPGGRAIAAVRIVGETDDLHRIGDFASRTSLARGINRGGNRLLNESIHAKPTGEEPPH